MIKNDKKNNQSTPQNSYINSPTKALAYLWNPGESLKI